MLISKEQDAGEDTDDFNVHVTKQDPVLKHYEIYVTEIQEETPNVTNTDIIDQLKNANN